MINKFLLSLLFALFLVGCSGEGINEIQNDDSSNGNGDDSGGGDVDFEEGTSDVTFFPLVILEKYKDWSGFTEDEMLQGYSRSPYIKHYFISPADADTLAPVTDAVIGDFSIKEDDIPINPKVSFPILQKVIGNQVQLNTAIVINTSSAMDAINKSALIAEIKQFISNASSHSSSLISNQRFTIWAYDGQAYEGQGGIVEETSDFQTNTATLEAALDTIESNWNNNAYEVSGSNHTYDAVVEAIGRFVGNGPTSIAEDLSDAGDGNSNDLYDQFTPDLINISNVVLFSAGRSSAGRFTDPASGVDMVTKALESQSLIVYDSTIAGTGSSSETDIISKSFIYVVPDGEIQDEGLVALASSVLTPSVSGGSYTFSSDIINAQISAVNERIRDSNQYLIRYASTLRSGEKHITVLSTKTADNQYGYSITSEVSPNDIDSPMPTPSTEITGPNGEYLAAGFTFQDYVQADVFADQVQTFRPATRWTNTVYEAADYSWASTGNIVRNTDGSVTIDSNNTFPFTITLTNTVTLGTFTINVYESY